MSTTTAKQPKLVREILAIINAQGKKRKEKLSAIYKVDFSGRPGQDEANEVVKNYKTKFWEFEARKITGKFPRGDERIKKVYNYYTPWSNAFQWTTRNWSDAFRKHLEEVAPNFRWDSEGIKVMCRRWDANFGYGKYITHLDFRPFANQIRARAIEISNRIAEEKRLQKEFSEQTGLPVYFYGKERTIEDVQANKACDAYKGEKMYCNVNGWNITVHQDETEDWEAYSKSWHNQHGPKRTIDSRYILLNNGKEMKKIEVNSFAGNYLINALIDHFKVEKPKIGKVTNKRLGESKKAVQLNPYFDVKFDGKRFGLTFYKRTFAGSFLDFCVLDQNGVTFHAADQIACVKGLKAKRIAAAKAEVARLEKENRTLTAEICHQQYGFCMAGIRDFADLNELDADGEYTIREIRQAVVAKRAENCARYHDELKTIGIVLNCK